MKREHDFHPVGKSFPRLEGPEKVTGRARYAGDMRLPGQLHARILRSPLPHGRIVSIDSSRAEALPGVRAVLSSANAPDIPWYEESKVFDRTVRFVGEEVAAVAADSVEIAEDALRLIEVRYDALPFAVSLEDGEPGEPDLRQRGDVAAGMRDADVVLEAVYSTQTALHNAMEPHGCTAVWEGGRLTLYESTQGIFAVRDEVAARLGLKAEQVRVVTQHMGGGFGAKQIAWKHSVIAALLARHAGRPVQLVLEREAENLAVGNRNATRQSLRLGARRDGRLTAIDVEIQVESGAYRAGGEDSEVYGTYHTLYRCPNVRTQQVAVRTNTGPAVAFRAPGYAEATFAMESAMDELGRKLDLDPIELRLRNYTDVDQSENKPYTSPDSLRRCYEQVSKVFGWSKTKPIREEREKSNIKRRGIGFAAHDWIGGSGDPPGEAEVVLIDEGEHRAKLIVGVQDIGTGTRTALCQIVAEELDLPLGKIAIELGSTDYPYGPTSAGSATLATLGPAARAAAESAKHRRGGRGERGPNPGHKRVRTCGAQCAEVEVDTQTGEVTVLRVVSAHDCGRIVNPTLVDSQVWGGVTQGLGYALTEARVVDPATGLVLNANLEDYKVPTIADMAEMSNATLSMPDQEANTAGVKGIGEPPLIPTAPAIANAVFDAIGVRVRDLPLSREKLIEQKKSAASP